MYLSIHITFYSERSVRAKFGYRLHAFSSFLKMFYLLFLGPFPWPVIGNQFLLKRLTHKLGAQHFAFIELSKRYNSPLISLGSGANKVLIVSGNESYLMEVLKSEEFEGRPWNAFIEMRNMGKKQGIRTPVSS